MSTEAATDLIGALIANLKRTNDSWESLAMVLEFSDGELSSTSGYLYSPGGAVIPTSARPSPVEEAVAAYLSGYYQPGDALPVKLLVQFDRAKGEYEVTFEDTDVTRWQVTPDNVEAVREELRPAFARIRMLEERDHPRVETDLIRAVVENLKGAPEGWAALAVVLQFDAEKVNGVYGFAYSEEGADFSVTASPYDLRSVVKEYTDTYYKRGEALPVALLIQFDRTNGQYEVTFEDSDAARWKATPANFDSIHEELRPDFT